MVFSLAGRRSRLLRLCERILADGRVSRDEIVELRKWLRDQGETDVPAVSVLRETMERVTVDKVVTREEREELRQQIENVYAALQELRNDAGPQVTRQAAARAEAKTPQCNRCGNRFRLWDSQWIIVGRGENSQEVQVDVCPQCGARRPRKRTWQAIKDWWQDFNKYG